MGSAKQWRKQSTVVHWKKKIVFSSVLMKKKILNYKTFFFSFFAMCGLPQFVHSIISFAITKGAEIYNV